MIFHFSPTEGCFGSSEKSFCPPLMGSLSSSVSSQSGCRIPGPLLSAESVGGTLRRGETLRSLHNTGSVIGCPHQQQQQQCCGHCRGMSYPQEDNYGVVHRKSRSMDSQVNENIKPKLNLH